MLKLTSHFSTYRSTLLLLLCVVSVYAVTCYQRYTGYQYWMQHKDEAVVEHVTAMSGLDSYYWLRMAKEVDKGNLGKRRPDPLKGYPDGALLAYKDTPSLLAHFISFGKNFTGGDYYKSGLMLIPLLAGLFVFPLCFYFYRLGYGASAVLGGLVGAFSPAYYARTKTGRIDTDLLNLFFPIAAACFMLPISRDKGWTANVCLAIGAGLMMNLFSRWYQQPSFILVYFAALAVYLIFSRLAWKQVPVLLAAFLLACGPEHVMQSIGSLQIFLKAYVSPPPTGLVAWPNVLTTVGEAQQRGVMATLLKVHGFLPLVAAGLVGLCYLALRHFRQMVPIAPLILIGCWSLFGPSRFAMYLAPFIGVGAGVLVELAIASVSRKTALPLQRAPTISLAAVSLLFVATTAYTGLPKQPSVEIDAPTTRALLDIKNIVPSYSAMFTPYWEYGYPLMDIGEFGTYHDGGLQGGMRSTLSAMAMMSPRQEDMVSLLGYVEHHGFKGLVATINDEKLSAAEMQSLVFESSLTFPGDNVYVLYLEKMIWKVFSLSKLGIWDFAKRQSKPTEYVEIHCFSMVNDVMTCRDGTIDLNRGVMNDGSVDVPLRAALFVDDGYVIDRRDYERAEGYYLQVLMKKGKVYLILVADGTLFRSTFNQQYLLGYYDNRYFAEVYNNFPVARVFKVKQTGRKESGETR